MRRHRFLRGPLTVWLFFMLLLCHFYDLFTRNTKKLISLAVLFVFYTISCSFCAPMFQFVTVREEVFDSEHLEEEDIVLVIQEEDENVQQQTDATSYTVSYEHEQEELDENEELGNYSAQELLADYDEENLEVLKGDEQEEEWAHLLVNKQHPIPEDYTFTLGTIGGSMQCDERVIPYLLEMLKAAQQDKVSLTVCSPYRNNERQQMLFERKVNKYLALGLSYMEAYKQASLAVTIPGSSEHQIGLAFDIYTPSHMALDEAFGETTAGKWLYENCASYGFILRYPKGKEYITGIEYEPWHFRFVGKTAAKEIMEQGICMEEYVQDIY